MKKTTKCLTSLFAGRERGQVLGLVLIFLLLSVFFIVPLLSYMGTAVKTGQTYQHNTDELYAANAGIDDGQWQIKYDKIDQLTDPVPYSSFDFESSWPYELDHQVNDQNVDVVINNEWIPCDSSGNPLDRQDSTPANLERLINGVSDNPLITVNSQINTPYTQAQGANPEVPGIIEIKIQYSGTQSQSLNITSLGIWLPGGYSYLDTINLDSNIYSDTIYQTSYRAGTAVVWDFAPGGYPFRDIISTPKMGFPGVDMTQTLSVYTSTINFHFRATSPNLSPPVAWIDTNTDLTQGGSPALTYTWDGNLRVYHTRSTAHLPSASTGTTIDSYISKYVLHSVSLAVNGDYCITGGSLMNDSNLYDNQRNSVKASSSNNIFTRIGSDTSSNKLPSDANIASANLYWSGWLNQSRSNAVTTAYNFSKFSPNGTNWTSSNNTINGHYYSGNDDSRFLSLISPVNLSGLSSGQATLTWTENTAGSSNPVAIAPLNPESCTNTSFVNNWSTVTGTAWTANTNNYKAAGSGKTGTQRDLTLKTHLNLSTYGSSGNIHISLDTPVLAPGSSTPVPPLNPDTCNGFTNWTNGSRWTISNGQFRGALSSGSGSDLVLKNPLSLATYGSTGDITISWNQSLGGQATSSRGIDAAYTLDGSSYTTFAQLRGTPSPSYSYTITNAVLTNTFKIRFSTVGNSTSRYWYLDNINVSVTSANYSAADGLDMAYSLNGGGSWTTSPVFRGNGAATTSWTLSNVALPSNFLLKFSLVGFDSAWQYCTIDNINLTVDVPDALQFSFYNIDGWSNNLTITSPYTIPSEYLTSFFKIRLYLQGFSGNGELCSVENIAITVDNGALPSCNRVDFSINSHSQTITTNTDDISEVISKGVINGSGNPEGYYYACRKDVTALVQQYSDGADWTADPKINGNGAGNYIVSPVFGDILADVKNPDDSYGNSAYAGWSLVIIYTSADTQGHYLRLYDWRDWPDSFSVPSNLFNSNGNSIATQFDIPVTGFVVPKQEIGEIDAAKVTIFVGEGDPQITGDYIGLRNQRFTNNPVPTSAATEPAPLWDSCEVDYNNTNLDENNPNNVWNGLSAEFPSDSGIDIDTYHIPWSSGLLQENDSLAKMHFYTWGDGYVLINMIVSFRSLPSTAGSMVYEIN